MAAFDSYFTTVDGSRIQNFTSGFSSDLRGVLDDINTNFERILSAPFVQGDAGKSVIRIKERLYENDNLTFTEFGQYFIRALYGTDISDYSNIVTYDDLKSIIDSDPQLSVTDKIVINGSTYLSCDYIDPDPNAEYKTLTSVDCYMIDPEPSLDGEKTFVPIVIFTDRRVAAIQANSGSWNNYQDFKDRSCALYGMRVEEPPTFKWDIERYQIMPTLYWDSSVGQFCWMINGQETGVTAQGIQGDSGPMIPLWTCRGIRFTRENDNQNIFLYDVLSSNQDSSNLSDIKNGDAVFVWFVNYDNVFTDDWDDIISNYPLTNFTIGTARKLSTYYVVDYTSDYDFRTITDDISLRVQLNEVGESDTPSSDPGEMRGLFVGDEGTSLGSEVTVDSTDPIHMMYSTAFGSQSSLHITPTEYQHSYPPDNGGTYSRPGAVASDELAPVNPGENLLCFDYTGIRSIPKNISNFQGEYFYSLDHSIYSSDHSKDSITQSIIGPNSSYSPGTPYGLRHKAEFRVTMCDSVPAGLRSGDIRSEMGLCINEGVYNPISSNLWNPNEYIFLGGYKNSNNHGLLPERYTYGGSGYEYDESPSTQIIRESLNVEDRNSKSYLDQYIWSSIFNFVPNYVADTNTSYLNFSYRRHLGLSVPSEQHELALCFTPKAEIINESPDRKWLRLYLPQVGLMRDATPRKSYAKAGEVYNSTNNTYSTRQSYGSPNVFFNQYLKPDKSKGEPNWWEYGELHRWMAKTSILDYPDWDPTQYPGHQSVPGTGDLYGFYESYPNELFLYDPVKFITDENTELPEESYRLGYCSGGMNNVTGEHYPVQNWYETNIFRIISGFQPLARTVGMHREVTAPVRSTKYNDYIDILIYDSGTGSSLSGEDWSTFLVEPGILNGNKADKFSSYIYCNMEGNYDYLNIKPITKLKLERPIKLDSNFINTDYYLADELYISYITAKGTECIEESNNYRTSRIEFSIMFADPTVFNTNLTNSSDYSNDRSILKYETGSSLYKNANSNFVSLQKYGGSGDYFNNLAGTSQTTPPYMNQHLNAIRNSIGLNFVVEVKWNSNQNINWELLSIRPSSNSSKEGEGHAEFYNPTVYWEDPTSVVSGSDYEATDRWIFSEQFVADYTENVEVPTGSRFYESFSWWTPGMLTGDPGVWLSHSDYTSDITTFISNLGLDPNKLINFDRLYYSAPIHSRTGSDPGTAWSDNGEFYWYSDTAYSKYYDFYELEIGNTRFGSRPRREVLNNVETGRFTLHDRLGDEVVKSFKLNYINEYNKHANQHSWDSWAIDDNGNYISDTSNNMFFDLFGGMQNSLGNLSLLSLQTTQLGIENNRNLDSVVRQLQADDINVSIESVDSSSRQYARNDVH